MADKEYIEREKIEKFFDGLYDCADLVFEPNDHCCAADDCGHCKWYEAKNAIAKRILSIPAADVRPVVRGRWVKARGSWITPGGDPVWECSECGKGRHVYGIEHGSYGADVADGQWVACPNCGAEMREES